MLWVRFDIGQSVFNTMGLRGGGGGGGIRCSSIARSPFWNESNPNNLQSFHFSSSAVFHPGAASPPCARDLLLPRPTTDRARATILPPMASALLQARVPPQRGAAGVGSSLVISAVHTIRRLPLFSCGCCLRRRSRRAAPGNRRRAALLLAPLPPHVR